MCGIIAYTGPKNGNDVVVKGLKNLEYRGYDSYGIASMNEGRIDIFKEIGKISDFEAVLKPANLSIGHTRWATSSVVTIQNAHPHLSNNSKIAVAHNGIVENYQEIKNFLHINGLILKTETDTEVIPCLVEYYINQGLDFKEAVRNTLLKLEGSFAIVAIMEGDDRLITARRDSPLVIGVGNHEFFVASDVPAFLEYCHNVIYLDDDEMAVVNQGVEICNILSNNIVEKEVAIIDWSVEEAKKGNYPHFMLKEISEQQYTIKTAIEQDNKLIEKVTRMIKDAYGIFFVGCGTSYHACVSASYIFSHVAKKHVNVVLASEFRNYEHFLTERTLVIGVSQSGETADLLDAIKFAKKHNCKTIGIVNVIGSSLTRLCNINIMMNSGPEICVLSTKSYTSQLAILLLLVYSTANRLDEGKKIVKETSRHVANIINYNLSNLKPIAEKLKDSTSMFLIGRDLAFPTALEGALKIKEVSYIHAEGFAGAELKHGTIALIKEGVPCIVLATKATENLILSNALEIKARGGYLIGIGNKINLVYDYFIQVPSMGDSDPLLMILPIQIFAYYLALVRGCEIDTPRNLAKSVTVR